MESFSIVDIFRAAQEKDPYDRLMGIIRYYLTWTQKEKVINFGK
jgi:hypothetical protein